MNYTASSERYGNQSVGFNRCGNSGLKLPRISFGLWHNFGDLDGVPDAKKLLTTAFDRGITHFDLANNYGTPPGSAEKNFGDILKKELASYRDELIISTKTGHLMWDGPYGEWGSKKHITASLDQSLRRMQLDYVDIFYSHRYDPDTPLEETMGALSHAVKQGKALYIGISKYPIEKAKEAFQILKANGTPCVIYQDRYSLLTRGVEEAHFDLLGEEQIGFIGFSPLAQGLLTDKYLHGIPENSRAALSTGFLRREQITDEIILKVGKLNEIAKERNQSLAQMALSWTLLSNPVSSMIIGASSIKQLNENLRALENLEFTNEELQLIEESVEE